MNGLQLQYLANWIERFLGTEDFEVSLNQKIPPNTSDRITTTLQATRVPFGLDNVEVENLNIKLTFDLQLFPTERRYRLMGKIQALLGWQHFEVTDVDSGTTYNCDAFLEQQQPFSDPRVDTGTFIQQLVVSGTCYVATTDSGAIVANRVVTMLDDEEVRVVACVPSYSKGIDENLCLSEGETRSVPMAISRSNQIELTLLYTGTDIENRLVDIFEGEDEGTDGINTVFSYKRVYPHKAYVKTVKLLSGKVVHTAGTLLQLNAVFEMIGTPADDPETE